MKLIFVFASLVLMSESYAKNSLKRAPASDPEVFKDSFTVFTSECSITMVSMAVGKLLTKQTDTGMIVCTPKKYEVTCTFFDNNGKEYGAKAMQGGIVNQEGFALSESQSDQIMINMVTRKAYVIANILAEHGALYGKKICAGDFSYMKDLKK